MVSDTQAVQTHFAVTLQLFWQSMTRRRTRRTSLRRKWRTRLHAAGIIHATGARLRAKFSGGRETCYVLVIIIQWERQDSALQHWCGHPTAAILMCHAWLSHPSLWGSLSPRKRLPHTNCEMQRELDGIGNPVGIHAHLVKFSPKWTFYATEEWT